MSRLHGWRGPPRVLVNADIDQQVEQFTTTSTPCRDVTLKADLANTGTVFVGFKSTLTITNGFPLSAEEQALTIVGVRDLRDIYVIADTDNQACVATYYD